ncbi:CO(2)-response secreted protease-like isoform X2 [Nicotiana sylvestris]|uniref:CO(2)-response secreted protease-like isoform X2 n=1 Tax=Nicotiana sylvestris TaxID=4096 RepID=UPI00388C5D4E
MGPVKELAPKVMISILPAAIATAAGSPVAGASYCGLAAGTAKGGSPGSRIAVYRICTPYGCSGSAIMKAFDYALADGVDIINLSIGQPAAAEFEFSRNPIAIGAFHAVEKGILVVTSAGNDGPLRETVVNVVPWIFTVSATTIDRNIETHIPLGRNKLIKRM